MKDDAVFTPESAGPLCTAGPDPFPASAREVAPREASQPAVQRHRAVHPALRGQSDSTITFVFF